MDAVEQLRVLLQRIFRALSTSYSTSQQLWAAFTGGIAIAFIKHATNLLPEKEYRGGVIDIKYGGVNRGLRESIHGGISRGIVTKWPKPIVGSRALVIAHRR